MKEKHQKIANFNNWYAYESLLQNLEFEAFQTYESWTILHEVQLQEMERY